ncbi:hypothetical protein OG285_22375 [Streptomyces sp. NBC_01471]|uniref:hypothetical protein n=1 Tax=Streptomyces sp. NBC_01471 TaxID=2903879 RepID=UPI00324CCE4E
MNQHLCPTCVIDTDTCTALRDVPDGLLAVFCLACAERGSGVLARLADPEDAEWFAEMLEVAWQAPLGNVSEDTLIDILDQFEMKSESLNTEDPDSKGFFIDQCAMLIVNAIAVHLNPSAARAEMSGQTLETILGTFDFMLSRVQSVIVRPGLQESPVGRLQRLEQEAQNSIVDSLKELATQQRGIADSDFLVNMRNTSSPVRDEMAAATDEVSDIAGWGDV